MPTIYIDNEPYEVEAGQNLLHACISLGFNLPFFCWHPALGSVGACRQCAVKQFKDENDTRGRIVMACMTPADDGTRIAIDDPEAVAFRKAVTEWLMTNHPHDCPVCDEGGECHLQDMTVMTGHNYRRFRFSKRTHKNQYLGPFINHEMNRCIQCYRCVRFYREYAGGRDFNVFAAHNHLYFGRYEDGVLENEFSGNLVEVCPTGVFTDKTLKKHYTRKWDLQTAPSICAHCGLGCNTIPGARYNSLRRIRNRYNSEVNGYFLCDRGRFGYEFVNSEKRLRQPMVTPPTRDRAQRPPAEPTTTETALDRIRSILHTEPRLIGIGSPRASLEANFALRTLVGVEHFHMGISAQEQRLLNLALELLRTGPSRTPSLRDLESADAMLILGEDITNAAPMLAFSLRQWLRRRPTEMEIRMDVPTWNDAAVGEIIHNTPSALYVATTHPTKLEEVAAETYHGAPDDLARLGFAVAHALDPNAPAVSGLPDDMQRFVEDIAQKLADAKRPIILCGTPGGSELVMRAAANVAWALAAKGEAAELGIVTQECNSLGAAMLGGKALEEAFKAIETGEADAVIVLENDLYRHAEPARVDRFLQKCRHLFVIDHLPTPTVAQAHVALPGATFAEATGTLVNNEGRAQRFFQVMVPLDAVQASWRWIRDLLVDLGRPEGRRWRTVDTLWHALAEAFPELAPAAHAAPTAGFRDHEMKIPRQTARYSGRTSEHANIAVSEPKPPDDPDSPLAFSMEGYRGQPPGSLTPEFWAPGWNSPQALNKFQEEVGGVLRGGAAGVRLIEPAETVAPYCQTVPDAFQKRTEEWLFVPLYHIFGSEELSVHSPGIAERAPAPYVALGDADLDALDVAEGDTLIVTLGTSDIHAPVRRIAELAPGMAGLPFGLPGLMLPTLPVWGRLRKEGTA